MKKLLIATAALAMVAGTVQAQSSVTLYGAYGNGLNTIETGDGKGVNTMNGARLSTAVIGLKGSEDLGGGLKAFFQMESTLGANGSLGTANTVTTTTTTTTTSTFTAGDDADSTSTSTSSPSNIFDRQAHFGLTSAKLGTLSLGRQNDSVKDIEGLTVFSNMADDLQTTTVGDRFANAVKYVSPSISGLTLSYTYSDNATGSGTYNDATTLGSELNSYNLQYTYSGIKFAYAHGEIETTAGAKTKTSRYAVQGKVMGATVGVSLTENDTSSTATLDDMTVAVSYPFGNGFTGQLTYVDVSAKTSGATDTAKNGKSYAVMLTKDLSKRTTAYVGYSLEDFDAANTSSTGDIKNTAVGLIHKF